MGAAPLTPAERDQALLVLALNGGNSEAAARELKSVHDISITSRSLLNWRNTPRYAEVQDEQRDLIRKHAITRFQEGALLSLHLARAASFQAIGEAERGELKDAAKTLQNATIAAGVATDKALVLNGEPDHITLNHDPKASAQALARRLGVALETTATDITNVSPLLRKSSADNARESAPVSHRVSD